MTGKPIIQLSGLTKVFHTDDVETHALAGIDLGVSKGEFLSISGPSGCGKSTLLSLLGLALLGYFVSAVMKWYKVETTERF